MQIVVNNFMATIAEATWRGTSAANTEICRRISALLRDVLGSLKDLTRGSSTTGSTILGLH
jgi:hypothetical protein